MRGMKRKAYTTSTGRRRLLVATAAWIGLALTGCDRPSGPPAGPVYGPRPALAPRPTYRLAVHPLHNPAKLFEAYQPLVDRLNQRIPEAHFVLEASRDYPAYERKFRAREVEFLLPNPWQTLQALKVGYRVIASAGDPEDFRGILLVRRDSGIRRPADLKGKAVSYPSATALAAGIMPQAWLHSQGINVNRDIENRYVGSQESSILNVLQGRTAAGATWPLPWRAFQKSNPTEAAELEAIWQTPTLINNAVMVRDDVPPAIADRVRAELLALGAGPADQPILAAMELKRFHPADNASYDIVRDYVARFEREVRPVESER